MQGLGNVPTSMSDSYHDGFRCGCSRTRLVREGFAGSRGQKEGLRESFEFEYSTVRIMIG